MRIAIIGGGVAGLTAAYEISQLARGGCAVEAVLFESSNRLGGLIETVHEGGFTIECGPDAWLTAKPAAAELAAELGLEAELIPSNDATRRTHILLDKRLVPIPDGFNLTVPTDLDALAGSPLFSPAAIAAYREEPGRAGELLAQIPAQDESVADFTYRHFGPEVLSRVAAPLLSGILGGDVHTLSARATLPGLIALERQHGSLIAALQASRAATRNLQPVASLFTSLRSGLGTLTDRLTAAIPAHWLRLNTTVTGLSRRPSAKGAPLDSNAWTVTTSTSNYHNATAEFDAVLLAVPLPAARVLLSPLLPEAGDLLPAESSSAVLVAFCFADAARVPLPPGFGFLVPPAQLATDNLQPATLLQACTFADQKFTHRVPANGRLLRAYFGGPAALRVARCNNDEIAAIARAELTRILNDYAHASTPLTGPTPAPLPNPVLTVVRRWPNSLPQYAVGHLDRAAELESRLQALPGLTLLGNALHGVGVPDLVHHARVAARRAALTTDH